MLKVKVGELNYEIKDVIDLTHVISDIQAQWWRTEYDRIKEQVKAEAQITEEQKEEIKAELRDEVERELREDEAFVDSVVANALADTGYNTVDDICARISDLEDTLDEIENMADDIDTQAVDIMSKVRRMR